MTRVYFDYNASAPLLPEAREALLKASDLAGNPASVHTEGRRAHAALEEARRAVAALTGFAEAGVIFTSGATEAATLALSPSWFRDGAEHRLVRLAVLETDHPCLLEGGRFPALAVARLPVLASGYVDLDALARWVAEGLGQPSMLAFCLANNETGIVQPLSPIGELIAGQPILLVVDAVQAAGRMPLDDIAGTADAMILSGHKIGAAKGSGALVLRQEALGPSALFRGGGQERGFRSGTPPLGPIASFGAAARIARADLARTGDLLALRRRLEQKLVGEAGLTVVGSASERLVNTVLVCGRGLHAETAQIALDLKGFAVSPGSACSSGKLATSHVLAAMRRAGAPLDISRGALRLSFGSGTTNGEIDAMAGAILELLSSAEPGEARQKVA